MTANTKKNVVVRIGSGLGNQLFRYAAGLRLASDTGRQLRFDLTDFIIYHNRMYQLNHFCGPAKVRHWSYVRSLLYLSAWLGYLLERRGIHRSVLRLLNIRRIEESSAWGGHTIFQKPVLDDDHKTWYLDGYYQNLSCLPDEKMLRGQLQWRHSFKRRVSETLYRSLCASNAVSVHVRRADYVNHYPKDLLSGAYYKDAVEHVWRREKNVKWIVFSDDPDWCRQELHFPGPPPLFAEGNTPCEDLRLMTACRHHIVANSTFSWWGAYLKDHRHGITILPEYWLQGVRTDTCLKKTGWLTIPDKGRTT
ncbi:MAG: alpha-1,2-fucosyltransferase [Kiritimatiellae bacterium]|nr:alpha-1,2-fucosyltransferase [Kiritimatiellia bacterium]